MGASFLSTESLQPRYGEPVLVSPRLGQGIFRVSVLDAYNRACAVTGEHLLPVLEAAHIMPYSQGGTRDVTNGLLLRSDIHRRFDSGYVTVSPDYRFQISDALAEDFHNGRTYYAERGRRLLLPEAAWMQPKRELPAVLQEGTRLEETRGCGRALRRRRRIHWRPSLEGNSLRLEGHQVCVSTHGIGKRPGSRPGIKLSAPQVRDNSPLLPGLTC